MEREELEQMTIKELQTEGKRLGLGVPSRIKKADLIGRIRKQVKANQKEEAEAKKAKKPTRKELIAKIVAETEAWDGPESKSPAALIRAGILRWNQPLRNLENSHDPLALISGGWRIQFDQCLSPEADCIGASEREREADQNGQEASGRVAGGREGSSRESPSGDDRRINRSGQGDLDPSLPTYVRHGARKELE